MSALSDSEQRFVVNTIARSKVPLGHLSGLQGFDRIADTTDDGQKNPRYGEYSEQHRTVRMRFPGDTGADGAGIPNVNLRHTLIHELGHHYDDHQGGFTKQ